MPPPTGKQIGVFYAWRTVAVIILAAIALAVAALLPSPPQQNQETSPAVQNDTSGVVPPPSASVRKQLAASKGFQALVSYTDSGFEPISLTIQQGNTVRFTNNSNTPLWIAEVTDTPSGGINPLTGKDCGMTPFNSCNLLQPGDFWEYTFIETGSFTYKNRDSTAAEPATITVE